jgi:hypothetical protein
VVHGPTLGLVAEPPSDSVNEESAVDRAIHVANEALCMLDKPELYPSGDDRLHVLRRVARGDRSILILAASHCARLGDRGAFLRTWSAPTGPAADGRGPLLPDPLALEAAALLERAAETAS